MSETEKAYGDHWSQCSDCQHQAYCEAGYSLRESLRSERE